MADELIVVLDFETPPRADDFGALFAALARDYRDMTEGRVLVVTSVESGSIIATLTDLALAAVPYAKNVFDAVVAANSLADFAQHLKELFGYAKSNTGKRRDYRKERKSQGQRSVEAILKIAANTSSHVRVTHKTETGETLIVELTPGEATEARPQTAAKKARAEQKSRGQLPDVQFAVERLSQADVTKLSPTDLQVIVGVVVTVLQVGGAGHLLQKIASGLELRGLQNVARAVRQHIRASRGRHEPPLTTT